MANLTCGDVRLEFSALLDDELSAEERHAVEAHLADCPECLRLFHQFQQVDHMYRRDMPQEQAPSELETRLREALTGGQERVKTFARPHHARQRVWPLLAAAAAFAILAGGVLMMATGDLGPESFQLARFDAPADEEQAAPPSPAPEMEMDVMMEAAPMDAPADDAWDDADQGVMNGIGQEDAVPRMEGLGGFGAEAPELFEYDSPALRARPRAEPSEEPAPPADAAPDVPEESSLQLKMEAEPAPPPQPLAEPVPERMMRGLGAPREAERGREAAGRRFVKDAGVWVEEGYEGEPVSSLSAGAPPWRDLVDAEPGLTELAEWEEPVVFKAGDEWRRLTPPRD